MSDSIVVTDSAPLITAVCTEKLNDLTELEFSTTADSVEAGLINEEHYAVVKVNNQWKEFIIDSVKDSEDTDLIKEVKASLSVVELQESIVETEVTGNDPEALLHSILSGTRWTVGTVEAGIYDRTFSSDVQYMTTLEAVFSLQEFYNCDIHFSYVLDGNKISRRQVNLYAKLGADSGKRFEVDKDITSIEREIDTTQLATAIYPILRTEDEDGNAVTTDISNLVWSTANGDPVNKPHGQKYLADPIALQNWGRLGTDGQLKHRMKVFEFDSENVSVAQMANVAWVNLGRFTSPKITYTVNAVDLFELFGSEYSHEQVVIGDTVAVIDRNFSVPVETEARVIELVRNLIDSTENEIVLGDSSRTYASSTNSNRSNVAEALSKANQANRNSVTALESANGKNTNYYGSVEPSNPSEGDLWFRPNPQNPEEEQLVQWDGTQWVTLIDDVMFTEITNRIEQAEQETADAVVKADNAVTQANQAVEDAGFATDTANTAHTLATNANQSAQDAVSQSSQAYSLAVQSATDASTALSNAQTAMSNAQNALNKSIKTNAITYAVSTSQTTVPTSGWQTTVPTASSTQYVWTRTEVTLQDNSVIYIYNVGGRGAQGVKGDTGASGANAPKITAVKPQFYLSTSNTSQAGGSWSDTIPTWVNGRHYWVRYVTTYDNSTTSTSTPTLDTGLNTALVTSLQAKSATETLSTTVSQHATQIEARALKTTVDTLTGRVGTAEGSITANATAITQRATKASVDTLTGRVSTAEGQISTQAGQIAQRLTASEVNSLVDGKGYATQASVNSQVSRIDGDINSWNSQLQSVDAKVDGMEIGGRNLIKNSLLPRLKGSYNGGPNAILTEELTDVDGTMFVRTTRKDTSGNMYNNGGFVLTESLVVGQDYTFSVEIRTTAPTSIYFYLKPALKFPTPSTNGEWKRVSFVHKAEVATKNGILGGFSSVAATKYVDYRKWKLEKGNKATDWSPAPEDLATVTALTTNVNQINQKITDTNNSIQLLTKTVTQNGQDISSVSADLTVADGKITGLTSKTDGHTTKIGNLQTGYDGLQSTVATVQSDLDGKVSTTAFSSLEQLVSGIQTTVADKEDKTVVAQLASQWQTTTDLANGHTSQISSLGTDINLRVLKSNVINQINVSTEGILIAGNKVRITGQTSIDNGVIKRAMIGDLEVSGAKIANATIASGKIISLDAGKINAGTINTSLVTVGASSGTKKVNITADGLVAYDSNSRLRLKLGVREIAGDGQSDPSNLVFYSGNGSTSAYIGTNVNDTFVIARNYGNAQGLISFPTGLTLNSNYTRFSDPNNPNDYVEVRSTLDGSSEPIMYANKPLHGSLGHRDYWWRVGYIGHVRSRTLEVGYGASAPHIGDLIVDSEGTSAGSAYVQSYAIKNRTYSNAPNMYVTEFGTLGRSTSARKYKTDIQLARNVIDNAKNVLNINSVSWFDKAELERKGHSNRYHGFIADDFHELGLTEVVVYGSDGQVESLAYDRISMYHNVILKEHDSQLTQLQQSFNSNLQQQMQFDSRLMTMSKEIAELKAELARLTA